MASNERRGKKILGALMLIQCLRGFIESGIGALNEIALKREVKRLCGELEILRRQEARRMTARVSRAASRIWRRLYDMLTWSRDYAV
jgi:hypothetical protein